MSEPADIASQVLSEHVAGDPTSAARLLPLVYDELRRLAALEMRGERDDHTLDATALVHEAWLRLVKEEVDGERRAHFLACAATAMRRILVEHARARAAQKRGGDRGRVTWAESCAHGFDDREDLSELSEALERLAALNERHARVVEMRFFGGLSVEEVSHVLARHPDTIKNDWRLARAWLMRELGRGDRAGGQNSAS